MNKEYGITTLLTTHDMVDMEKLAGRVIIINTGKKEYDGTVHGLRDQYSRSRRINVTFAEAEPEVNIAGLNTVAPSPFHRSFVFEQDAISAGEVMARLASLPYTIRDITIQEADIEEIIRNIYAGETPVGEGAQ